MLTNMPSLNPTQLASIRPCPGCQPIEIAARPSDAEEIPVGALVERVGKPPDLALAGIVAVEILAGEQNAHQQDGGVDARQLDVAEAAPALHVEEVIEEALVARAVP